MKILMFLSKEFITDPRVYKEAISLFNGGHDLTIVFWDRHARYLSEDIVNNVRVFGIRNKGLMKILPYDLFRNPLWWRKAYKKALKLYKNGYRFDVVHCHDLDTLQTGVWLKKRLNVKLIYDAHEIFSYMIEKNVPKFIVNFANKMEKRLLKYIDHMITVDDGYADYYHSIISTSITIVRNCKDLIGEYQPPSHKIFTVTYIGTIDHSRFFPQILHVVGKIKDVQFIIVGKKENNVYDEVKTLAKTYKNILFFDPIPTNKVLSVTREAHVVICLFDPTNKLNRIGSPNKLFEAMVTGRPIIVTKGTHASDIVEQEQCGFSVEYSDKGLEDAIKLLRDNPTLCEKLGRNGLNAAQQKYNWGVQQKELLKIYENIKERTH